MVINPAVKCLMVEKWFHPDNSLGAKLQLHINYVAGLIRAGAKIKVTIQLMPPAALPGAKLLKSLMNRSLESTLSELYLKCGCDLTHVPRVKSQRHYYETCAFIF
jgi:hypothetical protein